MNSLVTIIMPAYNSQLYITDAIESVINQEYQEWELLVVDDCSTDKTKEIIEQFAKLDTRIRPMYSDQNGGSPAKAKNIALKSVINGRFIAFLDSDDLWDKKKLVQQIQFMEKNNHFALCYSGGYWIDNSGKILKKFMPRYSNGKIIDELLAQYEINNQSVVINRDIVGEFLFDESITIGEDYNIFMNIARKFPICSIKQYLISYRVHNQSITKQSLKRLSEGTEKTIKTLENIDSFAIEHQKALDLAKAKVSFYKSRYLMHEKRFSEARKLLKSFRFISMKYFILYILAFFPRIWGKMT